MPGPSRLRPRVARSGLDLRERTLLARLATPQKIQAFLNAIPINHELTGETMLSVREVLRQRRAHCIEGAFVAACALWIHGEPPLILHLDCDLSDYPHVLAVFRRNRHWGAISKTQWRRRCVTAIPSTAPCASSRCRISTSTATAAGAGRSQPFRRVRPAAHRFHAVGDVRRALLGRARPSRQSASLSSRHGAATGGAVASRSVRAQDRTHRAVSRKLDVRAVMRGDPRVERTCPGGTDCLYNGRPDARSRSRHAPEP